MQYIVLGVAVSAIVVVSARGESPSNQPTDVKATSSQKSPSAEEGPGVQLETGTGTLFGTLDLPAGKSPWPVALIIAGSGPTDRDGNQQLMKNGSLRLLGKALAAHGVAALRYDKRGVAKSIAAGPIEEKLRFESYVDDAGGWVKQLRGDHRFNSVVIVGHSEGSLIGMLVAKRERIDALISIAGAGRDLATLLRDQLKRNLPAELYQQSSHIIDELIAGRTVNDAPPELYSLFRPSVQPYLMTWLKYDPAKEIADLKIPILLVQGTTDVQVSIDDAKLLSAYNKNAHLATIESMNHVLKYAPVMSLPAQAITYSDPSLPLAPHLIDEIWSFLNANLINKRTSANSR
jgi:pimeloyl-ACP methyl ester carboxylesterase